MARGTEVAQGVIVGSSWLVCHGSASNGRRGLGLDVKAYVSKILGYCIRNWSIAVVTVMSNRGCDVNV